MPIWYLQTKHAVSLIARASVEINSPSRHELGVWVAEEAAHVSSREREPGEPERGDHRDGHAEVIPVRGVVTGPHRTHSLSTYTQNMTSVSLLARMR